MRNERDKMGEKAGGGRGKRSGGECDGGVLMPLEEGKGRGID